LSFSSIAPKGSPVIKLIPRRRQIGPCMLSDHTQPSLDFSHSPVDQQARKNLRDSGLDGGGCWAIDLGLGGGLGFPGC